MQIATSYNSLHFDVTRERVIHYGRFLLRKPFHLTLNNNVSCRYSNVMRCYCRCARRHDFYDENSNKEKPLVFSLGREYSRIGKLYKDTHTYIRMYVCSLYLCSRRLAHRSLLGQSVRRDAKSTSEKKEKKGKRGTHHLEMIRGCVHSCIHTPSNSHYDDINKCRVHYGFREEDSVTE